MITVSVHTAEPPSRKTVNSSKQGPKSGETSASTVFPSKVCFTGIFYGRLFGGSKLMQLTVIRPLSIPALIAPAGANVGG